MALNNALKGAKEESQKWEKVYRQNPPEKLPWHSEKLDQDIKKELEERAITKENFLDLGTGTGTQANQLALKGFKVTATDISKTAIQKAKKRFKGICFLQDNILKSKLKKNSFDFVLDRGCFHTLDKAEIKQYLLNLKKILKKNGLLFLKVFSTEEAGKNRGPNCFSQEEIKKIFWKDFVLESAEKTVFFGRHKTHPKALFCVLKKN